MSTSDHLTRIIQEQIEPIIGYTDYAKTDRKGLPIVKPVARSVKLLNKGLTEEPRATAMSTNIRTESISLEEARILIVKARIRGGKIQRRKKVSNVSGYTLRSGKMTRMSATERRNRRMGQRRGKLKRRAEMSRTLMKRARSLRRREALGI